MLAGESYHAICNAGGYVSVTLVSVGQRLAVGARDESGGAGCAQFCGSAEAGTHARSMLGRSGFVVSEVTTNDSPSGVPRQKSRMPMFGW